MEGRRGKQRQPAFQVNYTQPLSMLAHQFMFVVGDWWWYYPQDKTLIILSSDPIEMWGGKNCCLFFANYVPFQCSDQLLERYCNISTQKMQCTPDEWFHYNNWWEDIRNCRRFLQPPLLSPQCEAICAKLCNWVGNWYVGAQPDKFRSHDTFFRAGSYYTNPGNVACRWK